ncbi:MAG TPA: hypothetical protein VFW23_09165 [Tepidisphaeraceae bacterium]|nr:hypothetical protein [Tepidisphaeraceae bacterium]
MRRLALGAGQQQPTAPRYQISVGPTNSLFVLDNETGVVSSVVRSGTQTGQPWMIDYQFSLNDALSRRGGAPVFIGPGRMR